MKTLKELIMENEVVFSDLDGTIIKTKSGETFPKDTSDWKFKQGVLDSLSNYGTSWLHIVTNQGGIAKGFFTEEDFVKKLEIISNEISHKLNIKVTWDYCASEDKSNPKRKPNCGMIDDFFKDNSKVNKSDCIMIGDASGKKGDFSDSDLKCAENAGVKYIDIRDFIKTYAKK